jgi:hypothetical protein
MKRYLDLDRIIKHVRWFNCQRCGKKYGRKELDIVISEAALILGDTFHPYNIMVCLDCWRDAKRRMVQQ